MSTAGSSSERPGSGGGADPAAVTSREPLGHYTPDTTPPTNGSTKEKKRGTRVVRWRGVIPLALVIALLVVGYMLFADSLARSVIAQSATDLLGTEVDIASLEILEGQPGIVLHGVEIADPFEPRRNLLEVADLMVSVEPLPLLEKKYIVNKLSLGKVRVGTTRTRAAKPVSTGGLAPKAMEAVRTFRKQLDVPLLHLAPIDSIKAVAVDPTRLSAVRSAFRVRDDADSLKSRVLAQWNGLRVPETLDSARSLATRLTSNDPRKLGLAGVRTAVSDVKRTLAMIDSTKKRIDALQRSAQSGVASLDASVRNIADSANADFTALRSLMALPSFAAPDIGGALFGPVTIDQLQKLLYWVALAEQYTPPGLKPKPEPGPKRLRMAGTTIHFVKRGELPQFWLKRGEIDLSIDDGPARGHYLLRAADVTSDPLLVGRPTMAVLERTGGTGTLGMRAVALMDRRGATPLDSVSVSVSSIPLPTFALPSTPFHLDPGPGRSVIELARRGDGIMGRWELRANQLRWLGDSARIKSSNAIEQLVWRVIGGVSDLEVSAAVSGTMTAPKLSARSNLDRVIADRVKSVIGEEAVKAEARLRAEVDRVVAERSAPVKQKVDSLRSDVEQRVTEARARLDEERKKLDDKLRTLTKGLVGLPLD
jgi:uncharacterized protein (TIGR03545 family)